VSQDEFRESLDGKRIGLIACTEIEAGIAAALHRARVSFATVQVKSFDPGDPELSRFDALVLGVSDESFESSWLRPEALRKNVRPLLLAGPPEEIYCRETLQSLANEVILSPFPTGELIFRLHRIIGGRPAPRAVVARKSKPIVLVVDDDINITNYLGCVLNNLEVDMHVVSDGEAALAAARSLLPDLILLDIGLPAMSGLDVLGRLRNDPGTRNLATVLLTASSDPLDVEQGAKLGVLDYIVKPFGHNSLTRKLKVVLRLTAPLLSAHATI
jgi:CheY-like chemotaxis protein